MILIKGVIKMNNMIVINITIAFTCCILLMQSFICLAVNLPDWLKRY